MLSEVTIELLKGRLKGQGFIHLSSIEVASHLKSTLFGFPLLGKPMIVVMSRKQYARQL
jgi:hypothetical protein